MPLRRVLTYAAAVTVIAIGVGLSVHRATVDQATAPTLARPAPSTQTVAHAPAGGHGFFDTTMTQPAAQLARQPGGDWRTFEAKLAAAESLRTFVYDVLRKPDEGGVYYAATVIFQCSTVLKRDTEGLPEAQRRAIEAMRARCDFSKQEADDALRQINAIRNLNFADDVVVGPASSFLRAKDNDAKAAVLGTVIDGGNPMTIGAIVSIAVRDALPSGIVPRGEGPGNYANYATMLVECQLGEACSGDHSLMVMELCTKNGWCADNVRDALRIGLGDKFAPIEQLATQMTNDIHKRNYPPLLRGS